MTDPRRPALVLLHAFGSAGRSFARVADRLREHAQVHAPDLPGHGDAADLPEPSVDAYAGWAQAQVGEADAGSVVLAGWSMGGKVALALAARRPPWLRALVLLAPSPPSPEPMDEDDRARQLAGHGDAALARASVSALMNPHVAPDRLDEAVEDRLRTSPAAWRWWLERGSRESLASPPVQMPAVVVVGADDPNLGAEVQRRLTLPALAAGRVEVLAGCRHFLPLEAPEGVAHQLAAALHLH